MKELLAGEERSYVTFVGENIDLSVQEVRLQS